jgi:hypothetical protein
MSCEHTLFVHTYHISPWNETRYWNCCVCQSPCARFRYQIQIPTGETHIEDDDLYSGGFYRGTNFIAWTVRCDRHPLRVTDLKPNEHIVDVCYKPEGHEI